MQLCLLSLSDEDAYERDLLDPLNDFKSMQESQETSMLKEKIVQQISLRLLNKLSNNRLLKCLSVYKTGSSVTGIVDDQSNLDLCAYALEMSNDPED